MSSSTAAATAAATKTVTAAVASTSDSSSSAIASYTCFGVFILFVVFVVFAMIKLWKWVRMLDAQGEEEGRGDLERGGKSECKDVETLVVCVPANAVAIDHPGGPDISNSLTSAAETIR